MRLRTSLVLACAALAAGALSACSQPGAGGTVTSPVVTSATVAAPTTAAPTTDAVTDPGTPTASSSEPAATRPVPVNKPFSNPELGERGTVLAYLRNFDVPAATKQKYSRLQDAEVVLVQVRVTAGTKYYDSFGAGSFYLLGDDSVRNAESTSLLETDLKAAGYPPLQDASTGRTSTGWIAFVVDKGYTRLTLQYSSGAATTSGGKTIPEKKINLSLV